MHVLALMSPVCLPRRGRVFAGREVMEELLTLERERRVLQERLELNENRQKELVLGAPPESNKFLRRVTSRVTWLAGLLFLQSLSSFVLEANTQTIEEHPTVVFFLTMLVGAGGNAGNQAAVSVIRLEDWKDQVKMAPFIGVGVACVGLLRVSASSASQQEVLAITLALMCIVSVSVVVGAVLPLFLAANAATAIQVIMDITGVLLTCSIANTLL